MMVDGLHMMQMLLPGTPITYYADELGIGDMYVRWNQTVDPAGLIVGPERYTKFSRDPERAPFPWDSSVNAGTFVVRSERAGSVARPVGSVFGSRARRIRSRRVAVALTGSVFRQVSPTLPKRGYRSTRNIGATTWKSCPSSRAN